MHSFSSHGSASHGGPIPRARLLVAEDDREMRRLLVESLRRDGHEIESVGSGLALLAHVRDGRSYDLVVSDVRMPGRTGLEVLADARARGWPSPVLLITAFGDDTTLDEAARLGAIALFSKPFDMDDLRTAVLFFLGGSSSEAV